MPATKHNAALVVVIVLNAMDVMVHAPKMPLLNWVKAIDISLIMMRVQAAEFALSNAHAMQLK